MKYKVGDKVICIIHVGHYGEHGHLQVGDIGIVKEIDNDSLYPIIVNFYKIYDNHHMQKNEIVINNKFFRKLYGVSGEV